MQHASANLIRARLAFLVFAGLAPLACGNADKPPPLAGPSTAGSSSGATGRAGANASSGAPDGSAGESETGLGGAASGAGGPGAGGEPSGGDAASGGANGGEPAVSVPSDPFTGPDPFPCATDGSPPPTIAAVCSPTNTWGTGVKLESDAGERAGLIGVTPDELTVVWAEAKGSEPQYLVADRTSTNDAFGPKAVLPTKGVTAVSPDGLRLVVIAPSLASLVELARPDRTSAFGSEAEGEFATLNAEANAKGWLFTSCIFAPDDRTLYYTAGTADERYPLRVSTRAGSEPWPIGEAIQGCELEAHDGYRRFPTGVSSDGKTLFFYDTWRGQARAAWRPESSGAFTWFQDLGDLFAAQPNGSCDHLYYSALEPAGTLLSAAAH